MAQKGLTNPDCCMLLFLSCLARVVGGSKSCPPLPIERDTNWAELQLKESRDKKIGSLEILVAVNLACSPMGERAASETHSDWHKIGPHNMFIF